jgi:RNA-directed DNA polymerase
MDKNLIASNFRSLNCVNDLSHLLCEAAKRCNLNSNWCMTPTGLRSLALQTHNSYREFQVHKKNGNFRTIHAPVKELRDILRALNYLFQELYIPTPNATAFFNGASIKQNAAVHAGSRFMLNLDLEDFFYSFTDRDLVQLFTSTPFEIPLTGKEAAFLMSRICTFPMERDGELVYVLPQGSPASPILTNFLCYRMDQLLNGVAKRFKIRYTRYADDLTFSGEYDFYSYEKCKNEIHRIIEQLFQFRINKPKTRYTTLQNRQMVTGVVVNVKPNVRRRYVKDIRMYLNKWKFHGYNHAEAILHRKYDKPNSHKPPNLDNYLSGKLQYMKMIKGEDDSTYLKLYQRFQILSRRPR